MSTTPQAKAAQPDRIWLQDGCTCGHSECVCDPSEGAYDGEVTWCRDRINPGDSEYLRATPERKAAGEVLAQLRAEAEAWEMEGYLENAARARAAIRAATGEGV